MVSCQLPTDFTRHSEFCSWPAVVLRGSAPVAQRAVVPAYSYVIREKGRVEGEFPARMRNQKVCAKFPGIQF